MRRELAGHAVRGGGRASRAARTSGSASADRAVGRALRVGLAAIDDDRDVLVVGVVRRELLEQLLFQGLRHDAVDHRVSLDNARGSTGKDEQAALVGGGVGQHARRPSAR